MSSRIVTRGRRPDDHFAVLGTLGQPEAPPDAVHDHALVAIDDLELHARDSVVHDVAQDSRIGEPHPPREMRSVGPVHGVVVGWENAQRFSDGSPVHALYAIDTQLLKVLTGSEEKDRRIPRLSTARLAVSRLSSAREILGRCLVLVPVLIL